MNNTKCPHIVDNSKSRTTVPHYYCRKTGKIAVQGKNLGIAYYRDECMCIVGEIDSIQYMA